jgi:hypothetical protein
MIKHLFSHLRSHSIAYLALFVALGGTSYASVKIPQHVNSQRSVKATGTCGGQCPAAKIYWAYYGLGLAQSLSPGWGPVQTAVGASASSLTKTGVGSWLVYFKQQPDLTNCARVGNLTQIRGSVTVGGYNSLTPGVNSITVLTTDASGQPVDTGFDIVVFCGGGQGVHTQTAPISG